MSFNNTKKRKRRKKATRTNKVHRTSEKSSSTAKAASEGRTAWHVFFIRLLKQKGPRSFEITGEFPFGKEPQRADSLLLRRTEDRALDSTAEVLKELWGKAVDKRSLTTKSIGNGPEMPARPQRKTEPYCCRATD